ARRVRRPARAALPGHPGELSRRAWRPRARGVPRHRHRAAPRRRARRDRSPGRAVALPRPTLLVARWLPTGFEAHAGAIERRGTSRTRTVRLPKELQGTDVEVYAYQVSGEARRLGTGRDAALDYLPWKRGAY